QRAIAAPQHVLAKDFHLPGSRQKEAEEDREGRRLSRAVTAEQGRGDAAGDGKTDALHRDGARITFYEIFDFDGERGHRPYMTRHRVLGQRGSPRPNSKLQDRQIITNERDHEVSDTSPITTSEPASGFGRISLRTLVPIRWVAIAGQALTILIVHYG